MGRPVGRARSELGPTRRHRAATGSAARASLVDQPAAPIERTVENRAGRVSRALRRSRDASAGAAIRRAPIDGKPRSRIAGVASPSITPHSALRHAPRRSRLRRAINDITITNSRPQAVGEADRWCFSPAAATAPPGGQRPVRPRAGKRKERKEKAEKKEGKKKEKEKKKWGPRAAGYVSSQTLAVLSGLEMRSLLEGWPDGSDGERDRDGCWPRRKGKKAG